MKRLGFTLGEMLVVLVIVGVLAAILLPSLYAAQARARQADCLSNLRQIGVALALYAQDNNQLFAYGDDPIDKYTSVWQTQEHGKYWHQVQQMPLLSSVLQPYIKDKEIWHCPSDTGFNYVDAAQGEVALQAHPSSFAAFGMSYYYRTELALKNLPFSTLVAYDQHPPIVQHSSAEINVLSDGYGGWHGGTDWSSERYNTLMADGHVRLLNHDAIGYAWSLNFSPPSLDMN